MSAFLDPIPATDKQTNDPVLLIALGQFGEVPGFVVMYPDGEFKLKDISEVNADFRYDWKLADWINVSPWGNDDAETDEEDDWGEGVSGQLPDPDRTGDGDQGDQADHGAGDMDSVEGGIE